ncbi:beta-1,3-galactosyltransferase 5-like [Saccostrea echinata]|uniref:beta-1,3-galactosyltransferase 5-like n=1 Tax=Saccostrea echinata TaxID=191078 RepID=UPI002A7F53D9|nr:beta-1,3-galactosyltransferase 5-like [Saccostrea echinata]
MYSKLETRNQMYSQMLNKGKKSMLKDVKRIFKFNTKYPVTLHGRYIINNKNMCRNHKRISALVMVHTAIWHFGTREEMRATWLNITQYRPEVVRVIFLVGTTKRKKSQERLFEESEKYNDIIQGDFKDTYRNLTNKGVLGLKWVTENCMNAEIIMKIDDDSFINLFKFFHNFIYLRKRKNFLFCNVWHKNSVKIERDRNSKWFVSNRFFRGYNAYPYTYCSGFAVFISTDLIPALFKAASTAPFFWVDDVYLFGILPSRVNKVVYRPMAQYFTFNHSRALDCYREFNGKCKYLVMQAKRGQIRDMWNAIVHDRI